MQWHCLCSDYASGLSNPMFGGACAEPLQRPPAYPSSGQTYSAPVAAEQNFEGSYLTAGLSSASVYEPAVAQMMPTVSQAQTVEPSWFDGLGNGVSPIAEPLIWWPKECFKITA